MKIFNFSTLIITFFLTTSFVCCAETQSANPNLNNQRIALLIGNSRYKVSPLKNPKNDAVDMAEVLRKSGFEVTLLSDATLREMENAVRSFGKLLKFNNIGLFTMLNMAYKSMELTN